MRGTGVNTVIRAGAGGCGGRVGSDGALQGSVFNSTLWAHAGQSRALRAEGGRQVEAWRSLLSWGGRSAEAWWGSGRGRGGQGAADLAGLVLSDPEPQLDWVWAGDGSARRRMSGGSLGWSLAPGAGEESRAEAAGE